MTDSIQAAASAYLARATVIPLTTSDISFTCAFKLVAGAGGSERSIVYLRGSVSSAFFLYVEATTGDLRVGWRDSGDAGSVQVTLGNETAFIGEWVHLTVTRNFTTDDIHVYMALDDGINFTSPTYLFTPAQGQSACSINPAHALYARPDGTFQHPNVLIAHDTFYSSVLTEAEAIETWKQREPPVGYPVYLHLPLSSTSSPAPGVDQSGNGRDLTASGSFTAVADEPASWVDTPVLTTLTPADGATGVSVSTTLSMTFDENVSVGTGNVKVYETVPPASAPTVITRNTDAQQTNATSFVIDTPGTPIAGDLQIICVTKDDNEAPTGTFPPAGFEIGQSNATGTTHWSGWIYRWCDGSTDPSTVTLTESSENWISRGWLIRGADPQADPVGGTVATGTSAAANPPNVTFPGASGDPCFILYYVGFDGNASASAHPGGYTDTGTNTTTDATTGNRVGQAYGELASSTSGSNDPGALTNTNEDWKAFTIAVRGAPTDTLVETIAITDGSKVSFSSATVTIDPAATLTASKDHYVTIDSGAILASDDSVPYLGFADRATWNFTTGAGGAGSSPADSAMARELRYNPIYLM